MSKEAFNDMRYLIFCLTVLVSCTGTSDRNRAMIVAHRGDWRNAPENSLLAIYNCKKMGIDVVEVDVRMTSDSVFVLMHDETIDRTTTLSGKIDSISYSELKTAKLKDGLGMPTPHRVPPLSAALDLAGVDLYLNLDKAYQYLNSIYPKIKEREMLDQIIFKGWMTDCKKLHEDVSFDPATIKFMPVLDLRDLRWYSVMQSYLDCYEPYGFEVIFDRKEQLLDALPLLDQFDAKIWVNTLWPWMCAGHDDERALKDADHTYGWLLDQGVDMIQTDRPQLLKEYLSNYN